MQVAEVELLGWAYTPGAPSITTQPADTTSTEGLTASFSVDVGGTPPYAFQWYRNGAAIVGANQATYTTPVLALANNGEKYSVKVSGPDGLVTSSEATLSVVDAPVLQQVMNLGNPNLLIAVYNRPMGASALDPAKYAISGGVTIAGPLSFDTVMPTAVLIPTTAQPLPRRSR